MITLRRPLAVTLVAALALAAASSAVAQDADAPARPASADTASPAASPDDADHDALRELRSVYEKAVAEDNLQLLRDHLHPAFTGVMVTGSPVAGYAELAAYWARIKGLMGEGGRYAVTVEPAELSAIIGDTAIAYGTTRDLVTLTSGGEYRFTGYWSAVLRKVDGRWLLYRIHGSMDPIDNPFNAASGRRIALLFGLIGAVAGSLIGWGFTVLRRRRS